MGDANRNVEFARFIVRQFPRARTVLVVADGKGELSRKLANRGLRVRVIEARPRFSGRAHKHLDYRRGTFTRDTPITEDLVVAMHPDEATAEVILAARAQRKPFAVVPCCHKGDPAISGGVSNYEGWLRRLVSLWPPMQEGALHIQGRNRVLYRRSV
ncbi:MAG: hypothetical protein BWY85_01141 [Firmicutes bacterium ADurb.Bin506]|nr:MAG: hypothetical protein BWY85_01141 [Firmicutes bacterium ADurb.Bin506]